MKITKTQLKKIIEEQVKTLKEAKNKENREGHNLDREERFQEKLANDPKFKAAYEAEKDPWKKQAMKNKLEEQVGLMVPPGSNVEEAPARGANRQSNKTVVYGIDIGKLIKEIDKVAASEFKDFWGGQFMDEDAIVKQELDDLKMMAFVRLRLADAIVNYNPSSVDKALTVYRKCDTVCRDKFPPLMWQLSTNQYEDLKAKGKIKKL